VRFEAYPMHRGCTAAAVHHDGLAWKSDELRAFCGQRKCLRLLRDGVILLHDNARAAAWKN
jgi:hypothetical protein